MTRRPYTPKGWPTMTLARWNATVGKPLQAQAPKPSPPTEVDKRVDRLLARRAACR